MFLEDVEALTRFVHRAGLELPVSELAQAWETAIREIDGDTQSVIAKRVERAGELIGFRTLQARGSFDDLKTTLRSRIPVLVIGRSLSEDRTNWMTVIRSRGRSVLVTGEGLPPKGRWLTKKGLHQALGIAEESAPLEWLRIEPLEQCSGVASHGHGHGSGHGDEKLFSRLVGLIRPDFREIRSVVIYAVGVGLLTLATPIAVEALVTTVAMSLLVQQLVVLTLLLFGCLGLAAALKAMQSYLVEILQRRMFVRVGADLAYRLPRVRSSAFDEAYGPELVNRFFDVLTLQKVGAMLLLDGVAIVLSTVIGLGLLAFYHPYLLAFDLVLVSALVFVVFLLGRGAVSTSIEESLAKYRVANQLQELTRAPIAYRTRGGYELALRRTDRFVRDYLHARTDHFRIVFRQVVFALGFQAIASACLLGLGGWLVMEGQLTLGQLVAAELIVATVAGSFTKLGKQLEGWYDLMAAVNKLGHLVDLPLERRDGEAFRVGGSRTGIRVELAHVGYGYEPGHEVLHDVSFSIPAGSRFAVVGPSGSGKSTLAELIFGLRSVTRGRIELDGVNFRDLSLARVREEVALVQDIEIVEGTILENLRLGRPNVRSEDIRRVLESVGLWHELSELPEGLHTQLRSTGSPLSRGQSRRLMLARALVGKPRLLILDESLDRLDLDSRGVIIDALFRESSDFTLLMITHDEELAQLCDHAVVLAEGRAEPDSIINGKSDLGRRLMEIRTCRSA